MRISVPDNSGCIYASLERRACATVLLEQLDVEQAWVAQVKADICAAQRKAALQAVSLRGGYTPPPQPLQHAQRVVSQVPAAGSRPDLPNVSSRQAAPVSSVHPQTSDHAYYDDFD